MYIPWPDFTAEGTLLIDVSYEFSSFPKQEITVLGDTYQLKDELHVTVIGSKPGVTLQQIIQENISVVASLKKIFENTDWAYKKTGPVHFLSRTVSGNLQRSIILLIDMPGMSAFYQQLKTKGIIAFDIQPPPPHITLYTRNIPKGIGVSSEGVLQESTFAKYDLSDFYRLLLSTSINE